MVVVVAAIAPLAMIVLTPMVVASTAPTTIVVSTPAPATAPVGAAMGAGGRHTGCSRQEHQ